MKIKKGDTYIRIKGDFNETIEIVEICNGRIDGEFTCKIINTGHSTSNKGDRIHLFKKDIKNRYKLKNNSIEKVEEGAE